MKRSAVRMFTRDGYYYHVRRSVNTIKKSGEVGFTQDNDDYYEQKQFCLTRATLS
jgi:hypothetical protein